MSKQELKELSQLADGEMKTFDLPCGSRITFKRFKKGSATRVGYYMSDGFEIIADDPYPFVEVPVWPNDIDMDQEANPTHCHVRFIVLDSAIPTLRAIFGSLSHAAA